MKVQTIHRISKNDYILKLDVLLLIQSFVLFVKGILVKYNKVVFTKFCTLLYISSVGFVCKNFTDGKCKEKLNFFLYTINLNESLLLTL